MPLTLTNGVTYEVVRTGKDGGAMDFGGDPFDFLLDPLNPKYAVVDKRDVFTKELPPVVGSDDEIAPVPMLVPQPPPIDLNAISAALNLSPAQVQDIMTGKPAQ
jgi:hypothetical protein